MQNTSCFRWSVNTCKRFTCIKQTIHSVSQTCWLYLTSQVYRHNCREKKQPPHYAQVSPNIYACSSNPGIPDKDLKSFYFEIPTLTYYCDIFSGILSGICSSVLSAYRAFYLAYTLKLYTWHSIWHIFWHSIWHSIWHLFRHCIWHSIWHLW